ncbi:MAG: TrmH family RNA methyltransferase [Pseudomonadota bacterium]
MNHVQLDHTHHRPGTRTFPVSVLAHDMDVPMNVGSLFRLADALGIAHLYLTGETPTPPNRKIRKTSRATEDSVAFTYAPDPVAVVTDLRTAGTRIVSLEITSASQHIRRFTQDPAQPICLIVGAENEGVPDALLALSDAVVHIPMYGQNSSMNVAAATAIALFELIKGFE